MRPRIGIMQGRLLPSSDRRIQFFPEDRWQEEFPLAHALGLDNIEFIFDAERAPIEAHPLLQVESPAVARLAEQHRVAVQTVCGDYFMRHPIHQEDARGALRSLALLARLIECTTPLGVTDIVIPCVDQGTLVRASDRDSLVERLRPATRWCQAAGVRLALETDLPPLAFRELLDRFESPAVTVNYDVGNSASLGFDPQEEWQAYGDRVSSVHIKDRLRGGGTVPLGAGDARFEDFFSAARDSGYQGLFVLQAAPGADPIATARGYKEFLAGYLQRHYGSVA